MPPKPNDSYKILHKFSYILIMIDKFTNIAYLSSITYPGLYGMKIKSA